MMKNAIIYRFTGSISESIESDLTKAAFIPCQPSQEKSIGWVAPRTEHGALAEFVGGELIVKLRIETKAVPREAVDKLVGEKVEQIEAATGRKPGKKERRELKEDALKELLPHALPRQSDVLAWIDRDAGLLIVGAGTQSKAELTTALVAALPGLQVALLQTNVTPQTAMTNWLTAANPDEWPAGLSVERECELKGGEPDKSVVKFTRHSLLNDEIRLHISQGKLPTKLALSWEGRVSFVLTEGLQVKKLAVDVLSEPGAGDGKDDRFDADVAIFTGEMKKMITGLVDALGGYLKGRE